MVGLDRLRAELEAAATWGVPPQLDGHTGRFIVFYVADGTLAVCMISPAGVVQTVPTGWP